MPYKYTQTLYSFDELDEKAQGKAIEHEQTTHPAAPDWEYEEAERCLLEECKEFLSEQGVVDADLQYSGFWSQGDGASITGEITLSDALKDHPQVEIPESISENEVGASKIKEYVEASLGEERIKVLEEFLKLHDINFSVYRYRGSHYVHENTLQIEVSMRPYSTEEGLKVATSDLLEEDQLWKSLTDRFNSVHTLPVDAEKELEDTILCYFRDFSCIMYRTLEGAYNACYEEKNIAEILRSSEYLYTARGVFVLQGFDSEGVAKIENETEEKTGEQEA